MLFTWDTENLCIVFRSWHITSNLSLIVSLVAVVALAAGYELLREGIRRYEASVNKRAEAVPRMSLVLLFLSSPYFSASYSRLCPLYTCRPIHPLYRICACA